MDVRKFVIILAGLVLVAFGIGMISLRINDNLQPISIGGRNSLNIRSNGSNVRIGWDGIDVKDGDDHVQVGWGGIKVKDGDEEVNVGWDGVKVKEGSDVRFDLFDVGSWFGFGHRNLTTVNINEQKNVESTGFDNIKVVSTFIDVQIKSEDRDDIYIDYQGKLRSNVVPTLEVEENGNTLNIELQSIGNSYTITESNVVLEVTLPKSFNGNLESHSSSGDISIKGITADDYEINASSGDIILDNRNNYGNYQISTNSGHVEISLPNKSNYTINGSSSSGRYTPSKDMDVRINSKGDFEASTGNGEKSIDITTSSGDVWFK